MRFGRSVIAVVAVASLAVSFPAPAAGKKGGGLRDRPFTVIAVVDSGINPYHDDFSRPELTTHPSTYIEGFPRDVRALDLSLDVPSYPHAVEADARKWAAVDHHVVWIPGTNIIAGVDGSGEEKAFLDEDGHGTAVASIAGGMIHGPPTSNVLIVALTGATEGVRWAARQPWIDFITGSWTQIDAEPVQSGAADATREAVARGKVVCFASGNFAAPLWVFGEQGPSWNVHVGAASRSSRGEYYYSGWPNDVMGFANVEAADHQSIDKEILFGGTSAATPNVCGLMAAGLASVRGKLGDGIQGPHRGGMAVGRHGKGAMRDGVLTNDELIDAIQATAKPASQSGLNQSDPLVLPPAPGAPWIRGGYGIVDTKTIRHAVAVTLGDKKRPDRAMEDAWIALLDTIRNAAWGDPP